MMKSSLHGAKKPKFHKVLAQGPKKVANKGGKSMGTTIGAGKKMTPKGSDSSRARVQPATAKAPAKGTFNARKYEATRRSVFGMKPNKAARAEDMGRI